MPSMPRVGPCLSPPRVDVPRYWYADATPDALAQLSHVLAPSLRDLSRLYLRLERARRLGGGDATAQVLVLLSWTRDAVCRGEVQAMAALAPPAAEALRRACAARGLRFVDNA